MAIEQIVRGLAWVTEGLDIVGRPEGKWFKALMQTAKTIHADALMGIERTDDQVWNAVPADVREGYKGDQKRLVADVRKTVKLLHTYANVFQPPQP